MVKSLPSNAGGVALIPGRELGSHMRRGQKKKQHKKTQKHETEAIL